MSSRKQVAWKHQPPAIREALREHRIRPMQDAPALNSMRLFLEAEDLRGRLVYVEGTVSKRYNPTPHAWLELDRREIVDLTLQPDPDRIYSKCAAYSLEQVREAFDRTDSAEHFVKPGLLSKHADKQRAFRPTYK